MADKTSNSAPRPRKNRPAGLECDSAPARAPPRPPLTPGAVAVTGVHTVGLPVILLHDGEGTIVTVELKDGSSMRGYLDESEDSWNLFLRQVVHTSPEGRVRHLDAAFVRGSNIVFVVFPNALKMAPIFKRVREWKKHRGGKTLGSGGPRGQAAVIMRKTMQRRGGPGGGGGGGGGGRWR